MEKKIKENNRIGNTRDLFKKLEIPKQHFMQRMGTIKDRNSVLITEAEDIKSW